ncbi:MAG: hypothetical protein ACRDR6_05150 [Pseudonocardiaceae bacterium]
MPGAAIRAHSQYLLLHLLLHLLLRRRDRVHSAQGRSSGVANAAADTQFPYSAW